MADRDVTSTPEEIPEIDETLEVLLLQSIDEAQEMMEKDGEFPPFTSLLVGNDVFEETHTGTTDQCFASAEHTVSGARGATAYSFCYDGYLDTDDGMKDCIIAEGGLPGEAQGIAVGLVYSKDEDGTLHFVDQVAFIAECPNYLEHATVMEGAEYEIESIQSSADLEFDEEGNLVNNGIEESDADVDDYYDNDGNTTPQSGGR